MPDPSNQSSQTEITEYLRQLAEKLKPVFWVATPDLRSYYYVSPEYEELWGRSLSSLYENPYSFLDVVHPDDRERVTQAVLADPTNTDIEYRIIRPDGSQRWIHDRTFPLVNTSGEVYRLIGIAEDITVYKQAVLQLQQSLTQAQELNNLKSKFIATTSNEFRTPLATIQSSAQILERYGDRLSDEKKQSHHHRIQSAVERITELLNEILALEQVQSTDIQLQLKPLDLVYLCHSLIAEVQLADKNQHPITFSYQGSVFSGNALPLLDEKLIRQLLGNLLSNALKYSPRGNTVEFSLTCGSQTISLQVKDHGIGIPQSDLPHLFDFFYRGANVNAIPGTGLGLSIVKRCVDLHSGEVTVDSTVGQGTTFTVILPIKQLI